MIAPGLLIKRAAPFAIAIGIWFTPVPAGLTPQAWHLFAVFVAAIACVLIGSFPLLTAAMIAAGTVVLTGTITPAQAFSGFANASVLLVVVAFIVAQAVVKSGLGRRISLLMVSRFGGSPLGLAYSIVLTDAFIAPAFPSNTARGGVLFPIVLSVAKGAGSEPDDPEGRRLGGYLMFCAMASLAVSSALWLTATSCNPIGVQIAKEAGIEIGFGTWLLASSVPTLTAIVMLPLLVSKIFSPGVGATPEAPAAARRDLASMGSMSRDERVTAVIFVLMVAGWVFGASLGLNGTAVAFMGLGALLASGVLNLDDIAKQGDTLATFLWLAVLFALSSQLNELGFMGYVGERLAPAPRRPVLAGPVRHSHRPLRGPALLLREPDVADAGAAGRVPGRRHSRRGARAADGPGPPLREQLLLGDHPQGGSQNIIFVASNYLKQGELYKLGLITTLAFMTVYLVIGTPWILFVMG